MMRLIFRTKRDMFVTIFDWVFKRRSLCSRFVLSAGAIRVHEPWSSRSPALRGSTADFVAGVACRDRLPGPLWDRTWDSPGGRNACDPDRLIGRPGPAHLGRDRAG